MGSTQVPAVPEGGLVLMGAILLIISTYFRQLETAFRRLKPGRSSSPKPLNLSGKLHLAFNDYMKQERN
jgi:hypothetical protein